MRGVSAALLMVAALGLTTGCGLFTTGAGVGSPDAEVSSAPARAPRLTVQGTEVVWEVPSEPVDGFILRYGEDPQHTLREVRLPIASLREERDPEYGPVYRYIIRGTPAAQLLYVSIAAFKGETVSEFSELVEEVR